MKILQVLNHFLPSHIGGTEVYACSLAKKIASNVIGVKVLIPHYNQSISANYIYDGFPVHQFAEPSFVDRSLIMGFRKPDGLHTFMNHLNSEKPDVVHFHEIAGSNGITLHHVQVAKKLGAKVIFTFHLAGLSCMTGTLVQNGSSICDGKIKHLKCSQCYLKTKNLNSLQAFLLSVFSCAAKMLGLDPTKLSNRFGTALGISNLVAKKKRDLIKLVDSCDKIIVLTNWYKDILISNGVAQDKIVLISQGLPIKKETVIIHHKYTDRVKFIFVGRISHFKGLHILVEAFQQLDGNKAELDIYGQADDVNYESNLKKLTFNMPFIQWKGALAHETVVKVMSQYDALCLCSTITEMSPLVIQEAFAAGIPVIASNVYGNAEQIKHGVNGLLFKFNDPADILKQLQRCIDEKELLSNLSRNILPPRSFEEVANDHVKLYNSLLT